MILLRLATFGLLILSTYLEICDAKKSNIRALLRGDILLFGLPAAWFPEYKNLDASPSLTLKHKLCIWLTNIIHSKRDLGGDIEKCDLVDLKPEPLTATIMFTFNGERNTEETVQKCLNYLRDNIRSGRAEPQDFHIWNIRSLEIDCMKYRVPQLIPRDEMSLVINAGDVVGICTHAPIQLMSHRHGELTVKSIGVIPKSP